ncbi:MAG: enoyl-[acyl-carrier-protein] reductase FabL [Chloroflexi bacterium]|nr:enoyl-[acyl-carrier-protein] reductase FabL [Chloroflexota bacterium]
MEVSLPGRELEGKVALVTGGSRGIGRAIALRLAQGGVHVAFNYVRHHQAAREAEEAIRGLGVRCLRVRAHLGDVKEIEKLFQAVASEFGRLDILVNNAASGVQRRLLDLEERHWDWVMDINAKSAWLCAKAAVGLMDRGGCIINVTSLGSQRVLPYYFSVGVSKAALEAVTRYMAVELAEKGIAVNAVSGGYVETEALQHFPNKEEMLAAAASRTPAGRRVAPDDIAGVVAFLCSREAEMIRGQIVVVDGGFSLLA